MSPQAFFTKYSQLFNQQLPLSTQSYDKTVENKSNESESISPAAFSYILICHHHCTNLGLPKRLLLAYLSQKDQLVVVDCE